MPNPIENRRLLLSSREEILMPTTNRLAFWKLSGMVKDAGLVTRWNESTNNGRDWIADVGIEPIDAGNQGMNGNGFKNMTLTPGVNMTYNYTIFWLVRLTAINSQLLAGTGVDRVVLFFDQFNSWISTYLPGTGAYQFNTTLPTFPFPDISVLALTVYDTATPSKIFLNGVQMGNFNSTNLGIGNSTVTRLMGNQSDAGANAWMHGNLAALAIYAGNLTNQEIVNYGLILRIAGLT